jgi:trans-aconitate 2-methyltransferase
MTETTTEQPDSPGTWDPAQYDRFAAERRQPFDDLLALCIAVTGGTVVDLGCGTGRLTAELHRTLGAARTIGIDISAPMLAEAPRDVPGLSFATGNLASWDGPAVDLVFANASLHWVDDHSALLARIRRDLNSGGQLAFQVPANFGHPSHRLARQVAAEPPFAAALGGDPPADRGASVLRPEEYAELLHLLGAGEQVVRLQVYGHRLAAAVDVVEWVQGTLLTPYRQRFDDATYAAFVDRYRQRLEEELGDRRPYFYAFCRILCWARFP